MIKIKKSWTNLKKKKNETELKRMDNDIIVFAIFIFAHTISKENILSSSLEREISLSSTLL